MSAARKPEPVKSGERTIDWTRKMVTSHNPPRPIVILPDEPLITQRKRVSVPNKNYSDYGEWDKLSYTTYLYDESGYCRRYDTYAPNECDLQYAEDDAAISRALGEGENT